MYKLYKRTQKTKEYPRGVKLLDEDVNPFKEGPCMLCVAATDIQDKSVFGLSKEGMKMARLRVRGQANGRFDIKDFPVNFLSLKLDTKDSKVMKNKTEEIQEFAKKYFYPLVSEDEKRIDCKSAMKNMRNVNIMSYCNGTETVQIMEQALVDRMQELGYNEKEISKIQSQMFMMPVATDRLNGNQMSTCISFKDINDEEVNGNVTQQEIEQIEKSYIKEALITYSSNESAYLMEGNGEHSLKEYQTNGKAMPVCLSSVLSKALENSIDNANINNDFVPLTMGNLVSDIPNITEQAVQGKDLDTLKAQLDNSIEYEGARRLSDNELELLDLIDDSCDELIKKDIELSTKTMLLESEKEKSVIIDDAMKKNCSDITYMKINMEAGYQYGKEVDRDKVINSPSDRQIVEQIELQKQKNEAIVTKEDIADADKEMQLTTDEVDFENFVSYIKDGKSLEELNKESEKGIGE